MPEMSGFEAVGHIQKAFPEVFVIFVTAHMEYAYQAYDYHPFWFVGKSDADKLDEVLNRCVKSIHIREEDHEVDIENTPIDIDNIIYFENDKHYIKAYCGSGEKMKFRCTFDELENRLNDYGFIRVQRGYIVNCRYISRIDWHYVTLKNHKKLTMTRDRDRVEEIRVRFGRYMREERC
jgi:DNA-binding LytR/AlgR family response regulator